MLPVPAVHDERSRISFARRVIRRPFLRWLALFLTILLVCYFNPDIVDHTYYVRLPSAPPEGSHLPLSRLPLLNAENVSDHRAIRVRDAYKFAYGSYKKYAAGFDELLPVSLGHKNNFNGWAVSMVDSLDTMWLMGLHDEFHASVQAVAKLTFSLPSGQFAPFFETVIRYLGGLLSAYTLSSETVLLSQAKELGLKLLPAFDTKTGLPKYSVNTVTGMTSYAWVGESRALFAEAATCQMEFKYLAHLTGHSEFYDKAEKIMQTLYKYDPQNGLFSDIWHSETGIPLNSHFSVGGAADSGYEYFLKQYLLSGKSDTKARDQYIKSANGVINNLIYLSPTRKLLYVTDTYAGVPSHQFEHLACFFPGLLALGVHALGDELSARERQLHSWAAEGLAHSCWTMYADSRSGLGPESVRFDAGSKRWMPLLEEWERGGKPGAIPPGLHEPPPVTDGQRDYYFANGVYMLRPETLETFFIMWKTTGDAKWRERGWAVFESLEKHAKNANGFASVEHVDVVPTHLLDDMPSYFLAETLKYLYLLFLEHDVVPLDKWVFNTEAHPLPVFQWKDWEKKAYHL